MSRYPLPEIDEMVKGNRKIGLGVMGFADLLYQLGIPYNSEKALEMAEDGHAVYPGRIPRRLHDSWRKNGVFSEISTKAFSRERKECAYRNATTTTIAPTGTLSIIAGCSSGIEPLFALSFVRNVMDNDRAGGSESLF